MKAYWVVRGDILNQEEYSKYIDLAGPIIDKHKGKFLVRGGKSIIKEGEKSPRTVLIEFPSHDEANAFYQSKDYQEAHSILDGFAERQFQIIEGI